ncbi:RNA methyltransferase [Fortiea contorta]|uniref:RNA methyltransferase n=1 Tax=Fortiea contorta TaxID=1892405 RepID=UPI00034A3DC8|nr:RNA methyltransferase [Fortiea contorta]
MALAGLRIVLVEPAGELNVGAIARVMKNFGLNQLVLVNPQCDPLSIEALRMAVHAKEILASAVTVATLPAALQGCVKVVATAGRVPSWDTPLENPRTTLPWLLEEPEQPVALIFGREDRGLSNEELNLAQRFVHIPTSENYLSLNLATAVGICCYELAQYTKISETSTPPTTAPAPFDAVEAYYQQLESLLLEIGYLYPHTAASRMEKFRQLYNRARLQTTEVAMLRGILQQVKWALKNHKDHDLG